MNLNKAKEVYDNYKFSVERLKEALIVDLEEIPISLDGTI